MKNKTLIIGLIAGFLSGLLGSGGGIAAVALFKKSGLPQKEAQATSLFVTAALAAVSAGIYLCSGRLEIGEALPFIPGGVLGALAAAFIFKGINPEILRKIFGAFLIFSGGRIIFSLF